MNRLRWALRLNVATCSLFGLLFLVASTSVGAYLGAFPPLLLQIVGAALVVHSLHLLIGSLRALPRPFEVYYFSVGDVLWFLGTLLLLVATDFITTTGGITMTLLVAITVAWIGLAQLWYLAEVSRENDVGETVADDLPVGLSRFQAIIASWLKMKTWVKVWLVILNIVFFIALIFWPAPFAQVVVAAYVASGPLLFALVILQRGLTKLLGIAHLIPWVPLSIYVLLRLTGDVAGPQITYQNNSELYSYAIVLLVFLVICIAFDVYDVLRWLRGSLARIGSQADLESRGMERPA